MTSARPRGASRGLGLLWAAAIVAVVHGGFSAYWALGGRWLLNTVGHWAEGLVERHPVESGLVLGLVALVKLAGAAVPLLAETAGSRCVGCDACWSGWARQFWSCTPR